jgi:hypothetical protein
VIFSGVAVGGGGGGGKGLAAGAWFNLENSSSY